MTEWRQIRGDGSFSLRFGGGLNERGSFNIDPEECDAGFNFQLDAINRTLRPRLPQDLEGTAPNAGEITGILQLIERDDTVTQVLVAGDTWYNWDGASVYSDVTPPLFTSGSSGSRMRGAYWSLDDRLVITDIDLNNPLFKWDGTTASRLKTGITVGSALTLTSLTGTVGGVATATYTSHGYSDGDLVTIAAATNTEYNGEYQIYSSTANTFQYTFSYNGNGSAGGTPTSDKGVEIKAKYAVVHDHRVWLFNIKADSTETPHMILVSAYEDSEDYDNSTRGTAQGGSATANDAFYILSPDGRPINGVAEFFGILIFSTKDGKLFKIVGDDAENYTVDEFYPGSSAGSGESMVNVGNDVHYFRRGLAIESLSSTDRFGDVSTDDLSFWIPTSIKEVCDPIAVYDSDKQKVYYFCSTAGAVLVFDKFFYGLQGQGGLSPWSKYTTIMSNAFSTKCAVEVRDPLSTNRRKTVFWGDDAGNVYNMNGTTGGGDGGSNGINLYRKSRVITDIDTNNELMIGRVEYKRISDVNFEICFNWADEYHKENVTVPLKASFGLQGANFWGGDIYWNQGLSDDTDIYWSAGRVVDDQISSLGFSAPGKGSAFIVEINVADVDDFVVSRIVL